MDDEKTLKTGTNAVVDTAPVTVEPTEESIRKADFEKARKKILVDHDELFKRLAQ